MHEQGKSLGYISKQLNRAKSTISRELKRNTIQEKSYSPSKAQEKYQQRKRRKCGRKRILLDTEIHSRVQRLFLEEQWSPEEISTRMRLEINQQAPSYNTIYRAIYHGDFDEPNLSHGNKGAIRKLRHRGKTRHKKIIESAVEKYQFRIRFMNGHLLPMSALRLVIGKLIL